MGVTFEDYDNLLARCEQVKDLDKEIGEIKKEWDRLTAKFFETSTKEEIIEALQLILMLKPKNYYRNNYLYNFIKNTCISVDKCNIIIL